MRLFQMSFFYHKVTPRISQNNSKLLKFRLNYFERLWEILRDPLWLNTFETVSSDNPHSMTKILITGGSGFLGKAIINELLDAACPLKTESIRVFDRNEYQGTGKEKVEFIKGDIRNYNEVAETCRIWMLLFIQPLLWIGAQNLQKRSFPSMFQVQWISLKPVRRMGSETWFTPVHSMQFWWWTVGGYRWKYSLSWKTSNFLLRK